MFFKILNYLYTLVVMNGPMKDGVNSMWVDITKKRGKWNNQTPMDWADKQPDGKASFALNYKSSAFVLSFKLYKVNSE